MQHDFFDGAIFAKVLMESKVGWELRRGPKIGAGVATPYQSVAGPIIRDSQYARVACRVARHVSETASGTGHEEKAACQNGISALEPCGSARTPIKAVPGNVLRNINGHVAGVALRPPFLPQMTRYREHLIQNRAQRGILRNQVSHDRSKNEAGHKATPRLYRIESMLATAGDSGNAVLAGIRRRCISAPISVFKLAANMPVYAPYRFREGSSGVAGGSMIPLANLKEMQRMAAPI